MARIGKEPEVVLVESGWTADGKPMFDVMQTFHVPDEVLPVDKTSRGSHGERFVKKDEFGITRPSRDWVLQLYESR